MGATSVAVLIGALAVPCATAPASTPPDSVHAGGALQPVRSDATDDSTTFSEDFGAPYASTMPILGQAIPWNWSHHVLTKMDTDICDAFDGVIDRHAYWFNEAPKSQQAEERAFLANVTTELCVSPEQSDEEYTTILHKMLATVRDAINKHVHSAFMVKSMCGLIAGQAYDGQKLNDFYYNHFGPAVDGDGEDCSPSQMGLSFHWDKIGTRAALGYTCLDTVAAHEKYNLAEGFYFLNVSMHMLERGAAFCLDPNLAETLAFMSTQLEARMAYHASNHGFDELTDSIWKQGCSEQAYDFGGTFMRRSSALYEETLMKMDAAVALEGKGECVFQDVTFDLMSYIHNNPPDALDAIEMFKGNTDLAVAAATEAVKSALAEDPTSPQAGCLDEEGVYDEAASARISKKLAATGLPQAIYDATGSKTRASAKPHFLIIPSVYHKLAAMCYPNNTTDPPGKPAAVWSPVVDTSLYEQSGMCLTTSGQIYQGCTVQASSTDANPILDIVTRADITQCSGEACKAAAGAIVAYHQLLGDLTSMRWDAVQVAQGMSPASPLMDQGTWVIQRSCVALENIVDRAAKVQSALPDVLAGLRKAEPQLEVSCVAPRRDVSKLFW